MNARRKNRAGGWAIALTLWGCAVTLALAASTIPEEIEQPGTQPMEVLAFSSPETGFDIATQACAADNLTDTFLVASDPGTFVWYLVRPSSCDVGGSYDSPAGQPASRDAGIQAAAATCL